MVAVASSEPRGLLETLRELQPRHFEQFVADVWKERQGWETKVMPAGRDRGIDVLGRPPGGGPLTAVQCKRYAAGNTISAPKIREYAALRQQDDAVEGVTVVTTSSFTSAAEDVASDVDVKLIDGADCVRIIERYDAGEILEWYAAGKPEDWP